MSAVARARRWLHNPRTAFALGAGLVTIGLDLLTRSIGGRLDALESRGWTPVDDVATVGDLEQLRGELANTPPPEEAGP